jgi:hypothetical protein
VAGVSNYPFRLGSFEDLTIANNTFTQHIGPVPSVFQFAYRVVSPEARCGTLVIANNNVAVTTTGTVFIDIYMTMLDHPSGKKIRLLVIGNSYANGAVSGFVVLQTYDPRQGSQVGRIHDRFRSDVISLVCNNVVTNPYLGWVCV